MEKCLLHREENADFKSGLGGPDIGELACNGFHVVPSLHALILEAIWNMSAFRCSTKDNFCFTKSCSCAEVLWERKANKHHEQIGSASSVSQLTTTGVVR